MHARAVGPVLPASSVLLAILAGSAQAHPNGDKDLRPSARTLPSDERKVALVVGNGDYANTDDLGGAPDDARQMAETLRELGFTVLEYHDVDYRTFHLAVAEFGTVLAGGSVGFFYYSGHGVQVDGVNYMVPVDAVMAREDHVSAEGVDVRRVLNAMSLADVSVNVVVLDACRNNPFEDSWFGAHRGSSKKGLASMDTSDVLLAYATSPGQLAVDSGVYARALQQHLRAECVALDDVFAYVRDAVYRETGGEQRPWTGGSYGVALTRYKLVEGDCGDDDRDEPAAGKRWLSPFGVAFRWVPSGSFTMAEDEHQHEVTVDGLWVMQSEVTQGLWRQVMGRKVNLGRFRGCGDDCPVVRVSWFDAVRFANALSRAEQRQPAYVVSGEDVEWDRSADGYRLLTEAEWEYAARGDEGGFVYADSGYFLAMFGGVDHGWNKGSTHAVCSKKVNGYGLCDMSGNVWEWVWDWYGTYSSHSEPNLSGPQSGLSRVILSSWEFPSMFLLRYRHAPGERYRGLGLRLARPVP